MALEYYRRFVKDGSLGGPETRLCPPDVRVIESIAMPELSRFFGIVVRMFHLAMVLEWAAMHRDDLRAAWTMASEGRSPGRIEPLE